MYGCETKTLTLMEEHQLQISSFEIWCFHGGEDDDDLLGFGAE
jgi:hypothetical protein